MASIRLRGRTYRAEVVRYGRRRSMSFAELDAARKWAAEQEAEILRERAPHKVGAPPPEPVAVDSERLTADGLTLTEAQILALPSHRQICGVYFLLLGDRIVYVGQSVDVHGRIKAHRGVKDFDRYAIAPCPPDQLAALERHYIKALRPPLNLSGVSHG